MLVLHCRSRIGVTHHLHDHGQIAGCFIHRRTEGMASAVEHQGFRQASLATGFSKLLGDRCQITRQVPAPCVGRRFESAWGTTWGQLRFNKTGANCRYDYCDLPVNVNPPKCQPSRNFRLVFFNDLDRLVPNQIPALFELY
jgi:hypothetical protein